jgi:hypothetical protein
MVSATGPNLRLPNLLIAGQRHVTGISQIETNSHQAIIAERCDKRIHLQTDDNQPI